MPRALEEAILRPMSAIDVHVSQGGSIVAGDVRPDPKLVAKCSLCTRDVVSSASLAAGAFACAPCLRERLDALSIARFRLKESGSGTPWGKVTG